MGQTDRQTERRIGRQWDRQKGSGIGGQTDRQLVWQTDRQAGRSTDRKRDIQRETDRRSDRRTDWQTDRQRDPHGAPYVRIQRGDITGHISFSSCIKTCVPVRTVCVCVCECESMRNVCLCVCVKLPFDRSFWLKMQHISIWSVTDCQADQAASRKESRREREIRVWERKRDGGLKTSEMFVKVKLTSPVTGSQSTMPQHCVYLQLQQYLYLYLQLQSKLHHASSMAIADSLVGLPTFPHDCCLSFLKI